MMNKTILVVDDSPDTVQIVSTILESKGFSVVKAFSGFEALAEVEQSIPDLVILDIMMPKMNGLQVLEKLRDRVETASTPVILLTAKNQDEDVIQGYKLGADYYITKPFTSVQLLHGINLLLGESQE
jgi:two-component system phosphate regulon response regulator PhoB